MSTFCTTSAVDPRTIANKVPWPSITTNPYLRRSSSWSTRASTWNRLSHKYILLVMGLSGSRVKQTFESKLVADSVDVDVDVEAETEVEATVVAPLEVEVEVVTLEPEESEFSKFSFPVDLPPSTRTEDEVGESKKPFLT